MRMRGPIALALLAAASAAPATASEARERARQEREDRENPEFYSCSVRRVLDGGDLTIGVQVEPDGRVSGYSAFGWSHAAAPGLALHYSWGGEAFGPIDGWSLRLTMSTERRTNLAQVVLRESGADGALIYEGHFSGPGRSRGSRLRSYSVDVRWPLLARHARAPGGIVVQLVERGVVAERWLDATVLDRAAAAFAAARPEIEAQVADYRNRCRPGRNREIVVT